MIRLYMKKISKIIILNLLMFAFIFAVAIIVLNIPKDIDFRYSSGSIQVTKSLETILANTKENIKTLTKEGVLDIYIGGPYRDGTIKELLGDYIKKSSILFIGAITLAMIIGIPKGILDSRRKKGSTFKLFFTLVPLSIPDLLSVVFVQSLGAFLYLKGIKFFGLGPIMYTGSQSLVQSIYPTIALSLIPIAYIARITTTAIESVYNKDYILAARGKGCSEFRIIWVHTLKNALTEVLAAFPNIIAVMFSSLIVVERIFYYKGIGYQIFDFNFNTGLNPDGEKIAFTVFLLSLIVIYYLLITITSILRDIILPDLSSE